MDPRTLQILDGYLEACAELHRVVTILSALAQG